MLAAFSLGGNVCLTKTLKVFCQRFGEKSVLNNSKTTIILLEISLLGCHGRNACIIYSDCKAAYRLSVVYRSVQTARIKSGSNPQGTNSLIRMSCQELHCSAVDHVAWRWVCNGGDNADSWTGEATEAGEVPRGFGEQRPGPQGDVQG